MPTTQDGSSRVTLEHGQHKHMINWDGMAVLVTGNSRVISVEKPSEMLLDL